MINIQRIILKFKLISIIIIFGKKKKKKATILNLYNNLNLMKHVTSLHVFHGM